MQKGFSPIAIIVIVLILLAAGGVYYWQKLQPTDNQTPSDDKLVSDEKIDSYGEAIARWGNAKHVNVLINGITIAQVLPNAGGPSEVRWNFGGQNNRSVLKMIVGKSGCSLSQLDEFLLALNPNASKESFAQQFSCLGKIEFKPVESGYQ